MYNILLQTIQDFYNKTFTERYNKLISTSLLNFLWAFTVSVYLAGGMVGIFLAGYFANRFGRRGALQFSHIFAVLAAVFFGISRPLKVYELLIVGRFIIGFSAGICMLFYNVVICMLFYNAGICMLFYTVVICLLWMFICSYLHSLQWVTHCDTLIA